MTGRTILRRNLKNVFPFRLGTTSYIFPDDIVPNVRALAASVDDIEIILFESDEISNLPGDNEIRELKRLAVDFDLSYTVHFPLDIALGHADETVRAGSVDKCRRIVDLVEPLDPFGYIVHCTDSTNNLGPGRSSSVRDWVEPLGKSLDALCSVGIGPSAFCVETLDYPFSMIEDLVFDLGMSVCLDVGHILLRGERPEDLLERYFDRTRVVHLHGIVDGRDHHGLTGLDGTLLERLLSMLSGGGPAGGRVVTLELFNEDDFTTSLDILESMTPWPG